MAVTITDNTTIINEADTGGDWSGSTPTAYTGFEREATTAIGNQASEGYDDETVTITSTDLSGDTLFGWMRSGNPHTQASNGFAFILGDGTDEIAYAVGGQDNYGHFVAGWSGFKMDVAIRATTPGDFRVISGVEANLTYSAITEIGYSMGYQSKALGNADNVFWDILRRIANGTAALRIAGGTTGDRGTFAEIVAIDVGTGNQIAYGILRTLVAGTKAYELFYGVEFGDAGTASTYFDDSDFQLIIVGTDMTAGNMDVALLANATGTNLFRLTTGVVVGVGTVANWDLSNANVDTMELDGVSFTDQGTFLLPANTGTKKAINCTWKNCGLVTPDTLTFEDNAIAGAAVGILWPNASSGIKRTAYTNNTIAVTLAPSTTGKTTYTSDGDDFSGNTTDVRNTSNATNEDSLATDDASRPVGNGTIIGIAQSWTSVNARLVSSFRFKLSKTLSPTGNATVHIYAHSGTYGTSSIPTGASLVASADFDVSQLDGTLTDYDISVAAEFTLAATTQYVVAFEYSGGDASNFVNVATDETAPTHGGNYADLTGSTWTPQSGRDAIFAVRSGALAVINATNGSNLSTAALAFTGSPPGGTIVNNTVTHTVDGLLTGERVVWIRVSDEAELENLPESSGSAAYSYNYSGDVDVYVQILSLARKIKLPIVTLGNTSQTLPSALEADPFYSNP